MQYKLTDSLFFFFLYGFGGCLLESSYGTFISKEATLRGGFLTNYFCPLYGLCGVLIIQIFTLSEISITGRFNSLIIATVGSILAVTVLEYAAGFALDKFFHHKMWDYSYSPFNLQSYVCLDFSLLWGIVALILTSVIHPLFEIIVLALPEKIKYSSIVFTASILFVNAFYNLRMLYHVPPLRL